MNKIIILSDGTIINMRNFCFAGFDNPQKTTMSLYFNGNMASLTIRGSLITEYFKLIRGDHSTLDAKDIK